MFAGRLGARRQITWLMKTPSAVQTMLTVFGVDRVAHADTVNNAVCALEPAQMQEAVCRMNETLIRKKVLCSQRLLDTYYAIAVDGTGTLTYSERHCEHCLTRTHNGHTLYFHNVLEAKLVTPGGFAFSVMSEFIVNNAPNPTKQDCELKAFYRLAAALKQRFPKLPVVLLLDGLFAGGPVFELCRQYGWKCIVTLKEGSLPSVNEEFDALCKASPGNRLAFATGPKSRVRQALTWANDINYIDSEKREHRLGVFECRETRQDEEGRTKSTTFRWVTNFGVNAANVTALVNQGGRLRWKIENEGFNIQKTGGYALEHAYTDDEQGMKNYYFILQMACIILQLLEKGSLLRKAHPKGFGSAKNLARLLLEAWRTQALCADAYQRLCTAKIQVRFDTS